ncbi:MAG: phosphoribosylanthranilate isomerase [Clostridiales bacterium]|jgi:phosphoribosylanthranilate isomerase|nr:phosphoribosylanthranilate isomerase [Clostridiales bacterium]
MSKVKISGVSRLEEADMLSALRPDYVGFVFDRRAPESISPELASLICNRLHPAVRKAGVFVNVTLAEIEQVVKLTGIDLIQLTGAETAFFISQLKLEVWKTVSLAERPDRLALSAFNVPLAVSYDTLLLPDAVNSLLPFIEYPGVVLSGGVTVETAKAAQKMLPLYAVDVREAVKGADGFLDRDKCKAFLQAVRGY